MNSNISNTQTPFFPDINFYLCPKSIVSLSEADCAYRKALLETHLPYNIEYANKLVEYQNIYRSQNIVPLKRDFSQFMAHMKKWKKKKGYDFSIVFQRRKKGYIKYNDKIRLFITNSILAETDDQKRRFSLGRICDEIGIRLILCLGKEDTHESVSICYEILNEIISFFTIEKGYNPMPAEPLLDLGFEPENYPEVVVPTDNDAHVLSGFELNVKDYYRIPKNNSYQSLHIAFNSSLYGIPFEVQIRTFATHTRVEYKKALHSEHDKKRYPNRIELDRENVNIHGYQYVNNEIIEDFVGLEKSVDPFNILY